MEKLISKIVNKCDLGSRLEFCNSLKGGCLHSVYHIKTDKSDYVIKIINNEITKRTRFEEDYELSEFIANEFKEKGLPVVSAIKTSGNYLNKVESYYFLVYPYISGNLKPIKKLKDEDIKAVGKLFSQLHKEGSNIKLNQDTNYQFFENNYWLDILKNSGCDEAIRLSNNILYLNTKYAESIDSLRGYSLITHRDLHADNLLWDHNNQPHILDWESAGMMNPNLEIIGYSLEWSGAIKEKGINNRILQSLLSSYINNGGEILKGEIRAAFYGWVGHCVLAWTEYNIQRMAGALSNDNSEIIKGRDIVSSMLIVINYIFQNETIILNTLQKILQ